MQGRPLSATLFRSLRFETFCFNALLITTLSLTALRFNAFAFQVRCRFGWAGVSTELWSEFWL
jgi:hypothetical protein